MNKYNNACIYNKLNSDEFYINSKFNTEISTS